MLRELKAVFALIPIGLAIGGIVMLVLWTQHPEQFPLRLVEIQNELTRIKAEEINSAVASYMAKGFFGLNVDNVQKKLNDLPWVAQASVRRIWPDRLAVAIKEKIPQALWFENGVLSTEAKIFYPNAETIPSALPRFKGPHQRVKEMLQRYFVLLEMLGPLGLTIQEMELTPDGSWQISLNNGIAIILGRMAVEERLAKFVLVYQNLQQKMDKIAYLDLRYTNGMSIGWKKNGEGTEG